ncbi:ArnT family glycosyltransferase [Streptomyces coffeae]|uniref:Glycosyltransferase family 39 protein n=1 Tax=Streptomyces coffeae TaxID=621382 RepID=A0ABS1NBZ7_9ACTN|nr:glycosyltransferase family 39 protein [Streptomyces coffeae]MBL1097618.1 glycosyltransferase family 39 protein [Streptomyces coffeae]
MGGTGDQPGPARFAAVPVLGIAAVLAGVLTALSGRYGFHRDELYFLAAGDHPDWGYVDQPPLTPLVARAATAAFGNGPAGLRVPATLCCAVTVVVVAALAREFGGGRRAQVIAAVTTSTSGYVLGIGHMLSTSTLDLLVWLLVCWLVLRLLRTGDGRWWLAVGAASGIGVQNKYLVVLLIAVVVAALLAVGPRRVLRGGWPVAGAAVALVLALPQLWWQARHGWPQLTVADGIRADDGAENRAMFVPQQILFLSPMFVPVWVAGWLRLWRDPALRWARPTALAYPLLCALVLVAGGRGYYVIPLLIVLMAAGCEPVAAWTRAGRRAVRGWTAGAAVAVTAAVSAVIGLPVLPTGALAVAQAVNPEQGEQVGWPTLVSAVRDGWSLIPADRRDHAVIFAQNYGEAGAIGHYGPGQGLPPVYSGHMSYADWGPPRDSADGPVLLVHQDGDRRIARHFTGCREVARVDNHHDLDNEEQHAAVELCSGTRSAWSALWPSLRHYY